MPKEISCLLVKQAAEGPFPSIHNFYLSGSTTGSNLMLKEIEDMFPQSISSSEEGALLSPPHASQLIQYWKDRENQNSSNLHSSAVDEIDTMLSLAKSGHSMVVFTQ